MDLTWVNVADTAVKIGLGALISAVSGYIVLCKTQSHQDSAEAKDRFYSIQNEKKAKYVELLAQSQELIQSHLYIDASPKSDGYLRYMRTFNEVQIMSDDEIRVAAFNLISDVSAFIFLRKNDQEIELIDKMVKSAREKVVILQALAQREVAKTYQKI